MNPHRHSRDQAQHETRKPKSRWQRLNFWQRWILANSIISGTLALCWLVLRSGTKPSRLAYPCQQAAISTATLAFGTPFVAAVIAARSRVLAWVRTPVGTGATALGLVLASGLGGYLLWADDYRGPRLEPLAGYQAELFHVKNCPQDPASDRFVGLDNLLAFMGRGGVKLYESTTESLVSGPDGIIAADDVVVIKINYQWDERGGTNVDVLRGLIRRIVDHPEAFTGEVIVCENAQFNSVYNFDRALNNAQDHGLSPHDVVVAFQTAGYNVSHYDWTSIRYTTVTEYSTGDMTNGYVVYPYDAEIHGRTSYPKFQTDAGTYISLKSGIWNPIAGAYDRERLKFINVPVLKSHHATYGATAAVKHYMGVVTRELGTNSHSAIRYGLLGDLLGEIQLADLNILDAIWINANPFDGPWTTYAGATRRDELIASVDPVATDIWAVKNILIPAFLANGYSPPWPTPSADPDNPSSAFRVYLDNSMSQILSAGYSVTNDLGQINVTSRSGDLGDFDGDSDVDMDDFVQFESCFTGPGGGVGPGCAAGDFDGDADIDCDDWEQFQFVWTDPGAPPPLEACGAVDVIPSAGASSIITSLRRAYPNPMTPSTQIEYSIGVPGSARLRIVDVTGRVIRTLVDDDRDVGDYTAVWRGRNDRGERVASGVYFCQLEATGFNGSKKIVLLREGAR
jgi:hypothetical protein